MNENALDIKETFEYLMRRGYKLTERTLYRHVQQGMLRAGTNNKFNLGAIKKYALTHLKKKGEGQKEIDQDLAKKKLIREIELREEILNLKKIQGMVEQGKMIPLSDFTSELIMRFEAFKSELISKLFDRVRVFIDTVGGDHQEENHVLGIVENDLIDVFNDISNHKEFYVVFEADQ